MMWMSVPDWLPYEVNELGEIKSIERYIIRGNRRWTFSPYLIKEKILRYDNKICNGKPLARVKLISEDGEYRVTFYVARLVYALFNHKDYNHIPNIHYRDGNPLNCSLDNLYETKEPYKKSKRFSK